MKLKAAHTRNNFVIRYDHADDFYTAQCIAFPCQGTGRTPLEALAECEQKIADSMGVELTDPTDIELDPFLGHAASFLRQTRETVAARFRVNNDPLYEDLNDDCEG